MRLLRRLAGAMLVVGTLTPVAVAHAVEPGGIAGAVTDNADRPLSGIEVTVWEVTSYGDLPVGTVTTNASGTYKIGNIIPDLDYKVGFTDPTGKHATEFYTDKLTKVVANRVPVTAGRTNTAIDASLEPGSTLSGRLTIGSGAPVRNGTVTLWWRTYENSYTLVETYYTDADGNWSIPGVRAATYGLEFRDPATGAIEAWDDRPSLLGSTPLVVASGVDITGIDAQLGGVTTNVPTIPTVTNSRVPRIKGTLRVGGTVRVTTGDWTPYPKTLTFAWLAGGKLIKGASHRRFTLKPQQLGKRLVVRVTASAPGYESLTVRTARSDKVRR